MGWVERFGELLILKALPSPLKQTSKPHKQKPTHPKPFFVDLPRWNLSRFSPFLLFYSFFLAFFPTPMGFCNEFLLGSKCYAF
jgi:hypothetical protein